MTTRDISILDPIPRHQTAVIEVPSGLKEEESLKVLCNKTSRFKTQCIMIQLYTVQMIFCYLFSFQLFSSFVQIEPQYLPEEAKLIHEECKGAFCGRRLSGIY